MTYDVITFGETMLRLTPPELLRIEQTSHYEVHVGGSESNVAVGLARLGLHVAWFSRITDNALGHRIVNEIRAHGVDTSHIVWTNEDRIGLYFYEEGKAPRGGKVIYDRVNSAMSFMQPSELPYQLFCPDKTRLLHLSGITLAIGDNAAQTAIKAATLSKEAGCLLSFDVNYRALLWSPEEAIMGCHAIASLADLLFLPLRDAIALYGTSTDPQMAIQSMSERYPQAMIVITLGKDGAIAKCQNKILTQTSFPVEEVGRLGGGDAFVAGFLYAYLTYGDGDISQALRWGAATAAYKYSIKGDMPLLDRDSIEQLVNANTQNTLLR